jgi:anti-anti-sigma factor
VQSNFRVHVGTEAGATVVTVSGELDLTTGGTLEEQLQQLRNAEAQLVIVDLRGVEFMDSTGLSVLVRAHQRAAEAGHRFALVNGGSQVRRLLDITGITERLTVVDSPEQLLG